ncbi:MAG TPA: ATP-binding cassette domain-containing protein, partial [Cyclobacteriaceae bacterium]
MVQIQSISFNYGSKKPIFSDFDLVLPSGNIYGLLGKNGAGKSTLLKIIAGLLFPSSGKIDVVGFKPQNRYPEFLQEIYMITEEFNLPSISADRFVSLYSPFYPRFNHAVFKEYISEFDLPKNQKLTDLSYGQK